MHNQNSTQQEAISEWELARIRGEVIEAQAIEMLGDNPGAEVECYHSAEANVRAMNVADLLAEAAAYGINTKRS